MNYQGYLGPQNTNSQFNQIQFLIEMAMGKLNTAALVEVMAVTNNGDDSAVGYVDVKPMVSQVARSGAAIPHQTIYNIPYFRLQGGTNAIILDPQVGDIGLAVFADRDISVIKKTKKVSLPGSFRQHSMADGLYFGGFLNGTPSQFVRFSAGGIEIKSTGDLILSATGDMSLSATNISMDASGDIAITSATLTHNGVNIGDTHVHGGVTPGGSDTGPPS